jgi:hypothetical protein
MLQENGLSFVFDRQREGVNAKDGRLSYSLSFATLICYFKLLRSPGIDSKESIPPAYVACRACTTTLFQGCE